MRMQSDRKETDVVVRRMYTSGYRVERAASSKAKNIKSTE